MPRWRQTTSSKTSRRSSASSSAASTASTVLGSMSWPPSTRSPSSSITALAWATSGSEPSIVRRLPRNKIVQRRRSRSASSTPSPTVASSAATSFETDKTSCTEPQCRRSTGPHRRPQKSHIRHASVTDTCGFSRYARLGEEAGRTELRGPAGRGAGAALRVRGALRARDHPGGRSRAPDAATPAARRLRRPTVALKSRSSLSRWCFALYRSWISGATIGRPDAEPSHTSPIGRVTDGSRRQSQTPSFTSFRKNCSSSPPGSQGWTSGALPGGRANTWCTGSSSRSPSSHGSSQPGLSHLSSSHPAKHLCSSDWSSRRTPTSTSSCGRVTSSRKRSIAHPPETNHG